MARNFENTIRVISPLDSALLRWANEFLDAEYGKSVDVRLAPNRPNMFEDRAVLNDWAKRHGVGKSRSISRLVADTHGHNVVEFERAISITRPDGHLTLLPSDFEAEFYVRSDRNAGTDFAEILHLSITRQFRADAPLLIGDGGPAGKAIAVQVEALGEMSRQIAQQLVDAQIQYDEQLRARLQSLEKDAEARRGKLEEEIEKKRAVLAKEEQALAARTKDLDDRTATHVRRGLRETITKDIQDRLAAPAASRAVRNDRYVILGFCLLGMVFSMILSIFSLWDLGRLDDLSITNATTLSLLSRMIAGGTLFVALLFYMLSFLRRAAREDLEFERATERYALDINRASWIVETLAELANEKERPPMPDELLRGVTANLFKYESHSDRNDLTALDALGELMRKGVRMQLGTGGAEVEIPPSAARKIGRDQ